MPAEVEAAGLLHIHCHSFDVKSCTASLLLQEAGAAVGDHLSVTKLDGPRTVSGEDVEAAGWVKTEMAL